MKRRNYKLKIINPCTQAWSEMDVVRNGRFCKHCEKTVTDFTNLTDLEIIRLIGQSSGKICGRLTPLQQNRRLIETKSVANASPLYRIMSALLLLGTPAYSFVPASPVIEASSNIENKSKSHKENNQTTTDSLKNMIQGQILDKRTKEPLPFARVVIKDTKIAVVTDKDGKFTFIIPEYLSTEKFVIVFQYIGYKTREIHVRRKDLPITNKVIEVETEHILMGEVVIIRD